MSYAEQQLRGLISRILRLKEEQDILGEDIREVYKEAHASGFDKTVLGLAVTRLRKEEKSGVVRMAETDSLLSLYLAAYRGDGAAGEGNHTTDAPMAAHGLPVPRGEAVSEPLTHAGAREAVPHDPETGEITGAAAACSSRDAAAQEDGGGGQSVPPSSTLYAGHPEMLAFLDRRRNRTGAAA